ncbi:MAG: 2-phospho-L-lactate transferase [Candidatus Kariarchaeaceae archaeon]|jgi:LPPG:FO 2-phospho-L-lactate transferase
MTYTFLSGGTGTPKLLQGFRQLIDDGKISVICNTGDDYIWNGLHISPDLDTVLYLFSNRLDLGKFWGVKNDSFQALNTLKSLEKEIWFNVGDKDLGLHLYRTYLQQEMTLTQITQIISKTWDISATILPMCNQLVQSQIYTEQKKLHFQEYFVKYKGKVNIQNVQFEGNKDTTTPQVLNTLQESNVVIMGPSNPITSMGPILSLTPIRKSLEDQRAKVIAISPIIGNRAFSGPTPDLMTACGIEVSPIGLAQYYKKLISTLILDPIDRQYHKSLLDLDIEPVYLNIELKTDQQKQELAKSMLTLF